MNCFKVLTKTRLLSAVFATVLAITLTSLNLRADGPDSSVLEYPGVVNVEFVQAVFKGLNTDSLTLEDLVQAEKKNELKAAHHKQREALGKMSDLSKLIASDVTLHFLGVRKEFLRLGLELFEKNRQFLMSPAGADMLVKINIWMVIIGWHQLAVNEQNIETRERADRYRRSFTTEELSLLNQYNNAYRSVFQSVSNAKACMLLFKTSSKKNK